MSKHQEFAVITGAASGIGLATAEAFARQGASLALIDQNKEALEQFQREYQDIKILIYGADISNNDEMKNVYVDIGKHTDQVTFLFANAGINGTFTSIESFDPQEWDTTIQINVKGTFLSVKYAIPLMKKKGGSIVLTSSVNGTSVFSNVGMSAYSSSKAAVAAFGKMAALELSHFRIRVNTICPGAIKTQIDQRTDRHDEVLEPLSFQKQTKPHPTPAGEASQVADLVLFLASEKASHISGTNITIDAAQTLV